MSKRIKKMAQQLLRPDLSPSQRHDWAGYHMALSHKGVYEQLGTMYTENRPVNGPTVSRIGSVYLIICRWLYVEGKVICYEFADYFPYEEDFYIADKYIKKSEYRFEAQSNLKFPTNRARINDLVR